LIGALCRPFFLGQISGTIRPGNQIPIGGVVSPFFTPADYPDLMMSADCRHPIFRKTS
jgi:hypothetical protein